MSRLLSTVVLLLLSFTSAAQVVEGIVLDEEHHAPVAGVSISNKKNGYSALSDDDGRFTIRAVYGDVLFFTHMSFETETRKILNVDKGNVLEVVLVPATHKLQQVIVSGRTKYQRDSAERHEIYGHELARPLVPKPKYLGLGCAGCFGWIADKITGNSKGPKRFKKSFAADDEQLFIDSRYNVSLVSLLTGMNDADSAAAFILRYPMEYQFARAATDLELKAWVRYKYREYKLENAQ
jgi:hypothetical protein